MVSLLLMQRVYELNAKVVQAADELMGLANNLRRG
jgi:flagellar basal-body rod protein FlgG